MYIRETRRGGSTPRGFGARREKRFHEHVEVTELLFKADPEKVKIDVGK